MQILRSCNIKQVIKTQIKVLQFLAIDTLKSTIFGPLLKLPKVALFWTFHAPLEYWGQAILITI